MKKFVKIISLFAVLVIFVLLLIARFSMVQYTSKSDIEAVNKAYGDVWAYESTVFKYENDNYEIFLYNTKENLPFESVLKKRNFGSETKFKSEFVHTGILCSHDGEWKKVDKKLRYIIVENENDIEKFDCGEFTPIKEKLYYSVTDGTYRTEWIYIIDETKSKG